MLTGLWETTSFPGKPQKIEKGYHRLIKLI